MTSFDNFQKVNNDFELSEESRQLGYGTAGFRGHASLLPTISFRVGALAALLSMKLQQKAIGIMVTASHNPPQDNGVKIIGTNGQMLSLEYEIIFNDIVKSLDFPSAFMKLADNWSLTTSLFTPSTTNGYILVAGDTRKSTPNLIHSIKVGVESIFGASSDSFVDYGLLTTPQLHYLVKEWNNRSIEKIPNRPQISDYYDRFCNAFIQLQEFSLQKNKQFREIPKVSVDCAHGVGAVGLRPLAQRLVDYINITLVNGTDTEEERHLLNTNCGADFVKMNVKTPALKDYHDNVSNQHWCSFDGDADRIVYWVQTGNDKESFILLDGDRIACLFAAYVKQCLGELNQSIIGENQLTFGMVHTAYTNAAATQYMTNGLGVETACVKTGVKYLHRRAVQYDIGVYFEANGHGTIAFSEKAQKFMKSLDPKQSPLANLVELINDCTGDAMCDLLLTEHILWHWGWSQSQGSANSFPLSNWVSMYTDWPSRQSKVKVPNRNAIKTNEDETRVIEPVALQTIIDAIVNTMATTSAGHARAFVRPSGTEDIVRIYAEAITQALADELAAQIAIEIDKMLT